MLYEKDKVLTSEEVKQYINLLRIKNVNKFIDENINHFLVNQKILFTCESKEIDSYRKLFENAGYKIEDIANPVPKVSNRNLGYFHVTIE